MTLPLNPDHHIVLISDSGPIPSLYVRFIDPIALITDNYNVISSYFPGADAIVRSADLLVVQRWLGTATLRLVEAARLRGIPIIYETDDNLLDLPQGSSMRMSDELIGNVEAVLAMADHVICSTEPLADAMARYNPSVQVIENYGLAKAAVEVGGQPHLAVVNTDYFKLGDSKVGFFQAIRAAINDLNYKVTFFGSVDAEMIRLAAQFPNAVEIASGFVTERSNFLDRMADHGINVAAVPLDDNLAHIVKSDIKFLDFASLGIPAIFNNKRVYSYVRHEIDGYFTPDSERGWFDALDYYADPAHRVSHGSAAREVVTEKRNLKDYADRLGDVFARLLDQKTKSPLMPIDPERSGLFWQSTNLFLIHGGVKYHITEKAPIAALVDAGVGFIDAHIEEYALVQSPKQLADARQVRGLNLPSRPGQTPVRPRQGRALDVVWLVPRLLIGGGGHRNIIRCAYYLERLGHRVSLYFIDSYDPGDVVRSQVREHFYPLDGTVDLLGDVIPPCDFLIATHWSTVAHAERLASLANEIIYFVQDFEPFFYSMGSEYVLAETTYRKGFYAITSGSWCEHFLRTSYGAEADHFKFPIDRAVYYDRQLPRRADEIVFFAKPEMPRRCYELGVAALRAFHMLRPDVKIVFYGSTHRTELDYPVLQLGVLPGPDDLAKLYGEATVGLAFSTTNPSLVPYEMMACGLPVIDLGRPGNEMNYDGRMDIARLANPEPEAMAVEIAALIGAKAELAERSANGLAFAATFPIEEEVGKRIEGLLLQRTHGWSNAAAAV